MHPANMLQELIKKKQKSWLPVKEYLYYVKQRLNKQSPPTLLSQYQLNKLSDSEGPLVPFKNRATNTTLLLACL